MSRQLSVIIPFCERPSDLGCIGRLDAAIACFSGLSDIEVVVFDTGRESAQPKLINQKQKNLCYFHKYQPGVFSPGLVRNAAVGCATGRFIFLFDADLLISRYMAEQLVGFIDSMDAEGPQAFHMFPCLYLSQQYSSSFPEDFIKSETQQALFHDVLESYLRGEVCRVDGIALASSCLLINKEWFMAIGGFREVFVGHGCEDFDLIHRLTMLYPIGRQPTDYPDDVKSQFPGDYRGFRRYFSYYAVAHLFNGEFLLHQWHPRPLTRKYHRKRKANEKIFAEIFQENVFSLPEPLPGFQEESDILDILNARPVVSGKILPDFTYWLREQQEQNGFPVDIYPGFFSYQQGVKKIKGSFWRKLRKLILKPGAFFQDMKK